jgi:CheY-like chemotaxis protein
VRASGEHLLAVISDILDFSKIEAGRLELEAVAFDLQDVLDSISDMLARQADAKGIELMHLLQSGTPTHLIGDPSRLRQVLLNLSGNAVKFTERGEVVIEVGPEHETPERARLRINVRDTGIGIPPDRLGKLFQSFSQVDTSTTRRFGGTGLGLAISKRLVMMMGGDIGVRSDPGRGSTFWFTVDLEKQAADARPEPPPGGIGRLRVLIADDNATNRRILSLQTAAWGCTGEAVSSGAEALDALRAAAAAGRPYDLLLLDFQMPSMDGDEVVRHVQAEEALRRTSVIMLTSVTRRRDAEELGRQGIAGHLTKPVKPSLLFDCIATVMGASKLERTVAPLPAVTEHSLIKTNRRKRYRILVVEDNLVNQKIAARLLQKAGYPCEVAETGVQALAALEGGRFDLVLMDCQMPEMDGFEATRRLRERERDTGAHLPVVAMTANAMEGDRERCLAAGMDDYLSKPIQIRDLFNAIERQLLRWRPSAEPNSTAAQAPPEVA